MGWGRCLKVNLQTHAPKFVDFASCESLENIDEKHVKERGHYSFACMSVNFALAQPEPQSRLIPVTFTPHINVVQGLHLLKICPSEVCAPFCYLFLLSPLSLWCVYFSHRRGCPSVKSNFSIKLDS